MCRIISKLIKGSPQYASNEALLQELVEGSGKSMCAFIQMNIYHLYTRSESDSTKYYPK